MATNAQIQSAITTAEQLSLTPSQMVALLDRAIAEATINGLPAVSYTIAGRTVTKAFAEVRELRSYYAGIAGSGVVSQGVEF